MGPVIQSRLLVANESLRAGPEKTVARYSQMGGRVSGSHSPPWRNHQPIDAAHL